EPNTKHPDLFFPHPEDTLIQQPVDLRHILIVDKTRLREMVQQIFLARGAFVQHKSIVLFPTLQRRDRMLLMLIHQLFNATRRIIKHNIPFLSLQFFFIDFFIATSVQILPKKWWPYTFPQPAAMIDVFLQKDTLRNSPDQQVESV